MHDDKARYLGRYLAGTEADQASPGSRDTAPLDTDLVVYAYPKANAPGSEAAGETVDNEALRFADDPGLKRWDVASWYVRLEREREQARTRVLALEGRIAALRTELDTFRAREREEGNSQEREQVLREQWEALRVQLEGRVAEQEVLLRRQTDLTGGLEESLQAAREDAVAGKRELGRMADELERRRGVEEDLAAVRGELARVERDRETARSEFDTLNGRLEALNGRLAALGSEKSALEMALANAEARLRELEAEREAAARQAEALATERAHAADLQAAVEALVRERDGLLEGLGGTRDLLAQVRSREVALATRVRALEQSHSWRLTKPLRAVSFTGRRLVAPLGKARAIQGREGTRALIGRGYGRLVGRPVLSIVVHAGAGQGDALQRTLEALARFSTSCRQEVVLVDQGAAVESAALPSGLPAPRLVKIAGNADANRVWRTELSRARGRWLVFLQPGVEVAEHCLDRMLRTFWERPDVALVCPKVLYPDGRLAAAGADVSTGGEVTPRGVGGAADPPEFHESEPVACCPPACLALDRGWLRRVKGRGSVDSERGWVDLCAAFARIGGQVFYQSDAIAVMDRPMRDDSSR